VQCEDLKKGGYTVIKGRPCKIVDMTRGRAGHGIKVYIVAIDIFTGLKLARPSELGAWSTEEMEVQEVLRTESTLVAVADGFLRLLDQDGAPRDDVRFPKGDLGTVIQAGISAGKTLLVTVVSAMGETAVRFVPPDPAIVVLIHSTSRLSRSRSRFLSSSK
ncbi:eukaryotic elongation factor 5A hypusine, DNA-binding OB fold-domain-containing protein, partial [Mycena vulgaris]